METWQIVTILGVLGLCFGSFVNALVWRLHNHRDMLRERSECTHCHHILAWYDLIPLLSWLSLAGKCRYCHKPIDDSPLVEFATAGLFTVSYLYWPLSPGTSYGNVLLGIWLICLVGLVAIAVYDIRWMLLPDKIVFPLIVLAFTFAVVRWSSLEHLLPLDVLKQMIFGVLSVAGVYLGLYAVSRGAWVGFGDVKLGIFMGLMLGWELGLLAVFLANLIGCVVIIPGLISKKLTPQSKIPFGPFLIAGHIVAILFGGQAIQGYVDYFLGITL